MPHWLLKTEPSEFSALDLKRARLAAWDGVANPTALMHLRAMAKGDQTFIYHTGNERAVVAIAEVVKKAYPDPTADDEKLLVVDLRFRSMLARPVTLDEIKRDKTFEGWDLLRIGRLSVVPTPEAMWARVIELAQG